MIIPGMDVDGFCLFVLFLMLAFLMGALLGYCWRRRDDKEFHDYLEDKSSIQKATLKEAKQHIRQMTIYELERWLNEKP